MVPSLCRSWATSTTPWPEFVKSLEKGDAVVTESGMYGTIVSMDDDSVLLKVDDNVRIRFLKVKVAGRRGAQAWRPS